MSTEIVGLIIAVVVFAVALGLWLKNLRKTYRDNSRPDVGGGSGLGGETPPPERKRGWFENDPDAGSDSGGDGGGGGGGD